MVYELGDRQARFVEEYLLDLNGTQAAIRAGYSRQTARQMAAENLSKPYITAAITTALAERTRRNAVDADFVLNRLVQEIEADLADLFSPAGLMLPLTEWPPVWRKGLVTYYETRELRTPDGEGRILVSRIGFADRIQRLELLGRHIDVRAFCTSR
jgi:phage terminase small subunit